MAPDSVLFWLLSGIAVLALLCAALWDVAARLIPNRLSVITLVCGLGLRAQAGDLLPGLLAGGGVFVFGFAIWWFGLLGGGDVKLLAAAATVTAPMHAFDLVLLTAILGGVLAGFFLAGRRLLRGRPAGPRPAGLMARVLRVESWRIRRGGPLPYGVAISGAAILILAGG